MAQSLRERRKDILAYIKSHSNYTEHNKTVFEVYEGNLLPLVRDVMQKTLSPEYFDRIKHRILPINVLKKIIDKLAKVYATDPIRQAEMDGKTSKQNQKFIDFYEDAYDLNQNMNTADEYANLFKGYALEPYLELDDDSGELKPALSVLPYDRFLVIPSDSDLQSPLKPEVFIKFMGRRAVMDRRTRKVDIREVYYTYTKTEFDAFDQEGDTFEEALRDNNGINPFGKIPFVYANRSNTSILPIQDTDILSLTVSIPVMLSDLAGAIMFQCFSIVYGIDVDSENLKQAPNAFWVLKSDSKSDKNPSVGTIKPQVDSDKAMNFIYQAMASWLETRGIKVGSLGKLSGESNLSGIAKILDEVDTSEARKIAIKWFRREEKALWNLTKTMHNFWVRANMLKGMSLMPENLFVNVKHDKPQAIVNRSEQVSTLEKEVNNGFTDLKTAIMELHPDWDSDRVDALIAEKEKMSRVVAPANEGDENGQGEEGSEEGREANGEASREASREASDDRRPPGQTPEETGLPQET